MLKQIPEKTFFEMLEAFFTGELSRGHGGKITADKPMKVGKAMFRGKFIFNESEEEDLERKNLNIFNKIANGFNLTEEDPQEIVPSESELISKCHTQLRRYLKFFVQNQILFDKNTLSFERTFFIFKKLFLDLENENSGVVRITMHDLNETLKECYPELNKIRYRIPFWEMAATLWASWITEIYHERLFDPHNHQVVLSLADLNDFSINGIRQTFSLPKIKDPQQRILSPDQRNIWYEDGILHFKNKSGGEKIIDMSTAYTQRKLFNAMWNLWPQGKNSDYYFSRKQIFKAYKKANNIKTNLEDELGSTKLGKIVANIRKRFIDKSLDKQLILNYKKISNDEGGYIFDLKPLI